LSFKARHFVSFSIFPFSTRTTHIPASYAWLLSTKEKQHSLYYRWQNVVFFCKHMTNWLLLPLISHICSPSLTQNLLHLLLIAVIWVSLYKFNHFPWIWKRCRGAQTIPNLHYILDNGGLDYFPVWINFINTFSFLCKIQAVNNQ